MDREFSAPLFDADHLRILLREIQAEAMHPHRTSPQVMIARFNRIADMCARALDK